MSCLYLLSYNFVVSKYMFISSRKKLPKTKTKRKPIFEVYRRSSEHEIFGRNTNGNSQDNAVGLFSFCCKFVGEQNVSGLQAQCKSGIRYVCTINRIISVLVGEYYIQIKCKGCTDFHKFSNNRYTGFGNRWFYIGRVWVFNFKNHVTY